MGSSEGKPEGCGSPGPDPRAGVGNEEDAGVAGVMGSDPRFMFRRWGCGRVPSGGGSSGLADGREWS